MASVQPPATMENLPSDVLSNIFIRLFAKQLAQMRCVSKTWNSLLYQSSFIKSHLDHSIRNNDALLLFFYEVFKNLTAPFSVHLFGSPDLELTNFIKLPFNLRSEGARVAGSVNGLICLYHGSDDCYTVRIWNPSLSAVFTLPPHSTPSRGSDLINIHFRFGFEPKSDDYKVIKLASLMVWKWDGFSYICSFKEWLPVQVYSMRKGSWQLITGMFPSHIEGISRQDEVCVDGHDGHLHWLSFTDENLELQTIVAFDLGVETFREILLPDSMLDDNVSKRDYNVLGLLDGKLCVMSCVEDGECEVWVMEEYGVVESWVKNLVLSQFSGNIYPYGFTLQNEFFFKDDDDDDSLSLAVYDPIAAKVKTFKTSVSALRLREVVGYVDSLVWIGPSQHDISSCSISRLQI